MSTAVHEIAQHSAVMPDGICLDAEGAVWVADVTHQRVIRVIEGGAVVEERKTDGVSVFACMLGGHDGRTLFTCAAPTFDDAEASTNHRASILTTRVDVPHAGLP
jgi:sugar lactone lactonase YvrE